MTAPNETPEPATSYSAESAEQFYKGEAGKQYHGVKRHIPARALPWVMRLRAEKFATHVKAADVVFEYGVGLGWNLAQLRCARRIGFDVADSVEESVKSLGIEFIDSLEDIPDHTADVALCHQTLEHLTHPYDALQELRRILRTGGRLVLHVPWELERRYRRYNPQEPNHHLYNWNAQNIGNLIDVAGFEVKLVRVAAYGYDRFAAVLACRLRLGESGFRLLRRALILLRPLREIEVIATA